MLSQDRVFMKALESIWEISDKQARSSIFLLGVQTEKYGL